MSFRDGGNVVHHDRRDILDAISVGGEIHALVVTDFNNARTQFVEESFGFDSFDDGGLFVI